MFTPSSSLLLTELITLHAYTDSWSGPPLDALARRGSFTTPSPGANQSCLSGLKGAVFSTTVLCV